MTLHCKASSRFAFEPGRVYIAWPGGNTPERYYVDLIDEAGALQRFSARPRQGVPNEHPLNELGLAFDLPAQGPLPPSLDTPAQSVWREIQAGGYERPLIIAPRTGDWNAKRWVSEFQKLASTEVRSIVRASDYNSLLVSGLPPAVYVSHLDDLFLTEDGGPSPAIIGTFDFLFVASS